MWPAQPDRTAYLCFGALQAAADHGIAWPVQHPTQLLAELERRGSHQARGLAAEPDEHVGPTVQDVHAARVQQALQLRGQRLEVKQCWANGEGSASSSSSLLPECLTSRIPGISSTLGGFLCSTDSL